MRLNLQAKLMIFLIIPAMVINLCTFIWAFVYSRESLIEEWIHGANAKLEHAADRIGCRLEEKVTLLRAIQQAENSPHGPLLQAFLAQMLLSKPGVRFVDISKTDENSSEKLEEKNLTFRVNTEHDFLDIVGKYQTKGSNEWVEIDVAVQFGSLIEELRKLDLWKGAKALLVTSDGLCLAATEPTSIGRSLSDFHNPLVGAILQEMKMRDSGTFFGEGRPPDMVMGFQRIPQTHWYLVLYVEGCEICKPMIHFRQIFLSANIASLAMILLLVVLVTRPIVQAIKGLSKSAKQVEQGDYSATLVTDRSDEIGQLQRRFNKMVEGLRQRDLIQRLFGRYVGGAVAKELLENAENLNLGGEERTVTILMADLRGFTPMAETLKPTEVVKLLNRYLSRMTDIIENCGGVIVDFYGDGILAFFNGPNSELAKRTMDALKAASCMQRSLEFISSENIAEGLPELQMGIGIHTGQVVIGNLGSEKRGKYGIVGSAVNTTKRVETIAKGGSILISEKTLGVIGSDVEVVREIQVELKGLEGTWQLFEVAWYSDKEVPINGEC